MDQDEFKEILIDLLRFDSEMRHEIYNAIKEVEQEMDKLQE